jgi:hypothetical protein
MLKQLNVKGQKMHSYHWGASDKKWAHIHHNGDYSGDVIIVMPDEIARVEVTPAYGDQVPSVAVRVPFRALKAFMMNYLQKEALGVIEEMSPKDFEKMMIGIMKSEEK